MNRKEKSSKINNVELNVLLNNINNNMRDYSDDVNKRMNISDTLEMKRLNEEANKLSEEVRESEQEFSQSKMLGLVR